MIPQGTFQTGDGLHLFQRCWMAEGEVRAIMVLIHGYAEHIGRYEHLGSYLARHGMAVAAYDQRGHGRSEGRRAYIDAFGYYLDDLHTFLDAVRHSAPGLPFFLFGHSMGGTVATRYVLDYEANFNGLILSSPLLAIPYDTAPLLRKLSTVLGRWTPRLPTIGLDLKLLSRDPAVVARTDADPLYFHGRLPARTGAEIARTIEYIQARMESVTLPLLIIHGTADRIADPQGSIALFQRTESTDKTLALYPNFFHETLNEPEHQQVLDEIRAWLDEHVSEERELENH